MTYGSERGNGMHCFAIPSVTSAIDLTTATEPWGSIITDAPLVSPLYRFCSEHSLSEFVRETVRLAREVFEVAGPITAKKDVDPETGDEAAVINVPVTGTPEVLYRNYKQYLRATKGFPDYVQLRLRLMIDPV
jgi:hypothetical protein